MVDRYIFLKLLPEHATAAGRAAVAAHTRATLARIPEVAAVIAGTPADDAAVKSWDVSIVVRFHRIEDVAGYLSHPIHTEFVASYLEPKLQVIKAWNFDVGAG
jgi:stress responsive alpha/beta barrel protein